MTAPGERRSVDVERHSGWDKNKNKTKSSFCYKVRLTNIEKLQCNLNKLLRVEMKNCLNSVNDGEN